MKLSLIAIAAALAAGGVHAADITLSGLAGFHNDKIVIDFTVAGDSGVKIWTSSWQSGLNFDPQISLFIGNDLVTTDDDNGSLVDTSAGFYDAGLQFGVSFATSYRLVLTASPNSPLGSTLSAGFTYDAAAPIALADWNQPSYDINANDQKGGFWRVTLNGVEQASVVPEPASQGLLMAGLLGLIGLRHLNARRQS